MKNYFIIIFLCIGLISHAQNNISGLVKDRETGNPLEAVNIYIPELNKGAATDAGGKFIIRQIPDGVFTIEFSYVGYQTEVIAASFAGADEKIELELQPVILMSDELVVSGGYLSMQDDNAVKIDAINKKSLRRMGSPNYMEAISNVPGVDIISRGSGISKPVIRGLSGNDVLVLNNGVRVENYQFGENHPLGLNEFGIGKVEIVKGPASLLYGSDAIGGVINFIPGYPAPSNSITGHFNSAFNSVTNGISSDLQIKASGDKAFAGLLVGLKSNADYLQGGGGFAPNTRFNEQAVKACMGTANNFGSFKLYYDYNRSKFGMLVPDIIKEELVTERGRKVDQWYQFLENHMIISKNKLFFKKFKIDLDASYQLNHRRLFEEDEEPGVEMQLHTLTYQSRIHFDLSGSMKLIGGFQGMNQKNENLNNRETVFLPNATTSNYSLFGLLNWDLSSGLRAQAGIRFDHRIIDSPEMHAKGGHAHGEEEGQHEDEEELYLPEVDKSYNNLSGSLGFTYNITDRWLWRANLAAAYRAPNLFELTSNGIHAGRFEEGNPNLEAQKSREADLSTHYHSRLFSFDLAVYYNQIRDYIYIAATNDTAPVGGGILYRYNQTDAALHGMEAGIHFHPPNLEWLHLKSTYSAVRGKRDDGGYLPLMPTDHLKMEMRFDLNILALPEKPFVLISSEYAFKQDRPAGFESETDDYLLIGLAVGTTFKWGKQKSEIGLRVNNLTDVEYTSHLSTLKPMGIYNPGRNIHIYFSLPFQVIKEN